MPTFHNISGTATTTNANTLLGGPDFGARLVRLLTLYNPNATASTFLLRIIAPLDNQNERRIRRFDDSIPATDSWIFGTLGAYMTIEPGQRLELLLDVSPALPIEWSLDYADTP